ncbi:MAG: cation acetate symporter [Zoogloeaceae bacterium]|jgi:cation/acetate symporter|nr:cation acetate symporter [Zoogloeaceae bacterium]
MDHEVITTIFIVSLLFALGIARLAGERNRAHARFHNMGGGITGFQNGLAMSGVSLCAAAFLGIPALFLRAGYDGLLYLIGFLAGWPILAFLLAERLRNLGRFTLADVVASRLRRAAVRNAAALATLVVTLVFLAAQLAGVGQVIRLLFGLEYWMALLVTGAAMMFYVRKNGMVATAWIEIVNAVLLLLGALALALLTLWAFWAADDLPASDSAHLLAARDAFSIFPEDPLSPLSMLSLGLAFLFGLSGLPHVLMRLFTVQEAREARRAAAWAMLWNSGFYALCAIFSLGVLVFVPQAAVFHDAEGQLRAGENAASLYLAQLLGGDVFMGYAATAAFLAALGATAGLMRAGAAAVSHDLYAMNIRKGRLDAQSEFNVAQRASLALGVAAILLALLAEDLNLAVMVGLALSIAASSTFPMLILSIFWKNCTARGAAVGGHAGLCAAVLLIILSQPVWVEMLGHETAIFPYASPTLFSMSAAFFLIWLFSVTDKSAAAQTERQAFPAHQTRAETGLG